ncbi:MAG TPA: ABC transporter permease [Clostridia bacterium]|nr:ABC transporter permease [Clostridia bacterium]
MKISKRKLHKYKEISVGLILVAIVLFCAVFAPLITEYDPQEIAVMQRLQPPGNGHIWGTDHFGRDLFSRVIYGTRISMIVAVSVLIVCGIVGTFLGLISGYYKRLDSIIMRILDGIRAFPSILLALVILAALGPGLGNIVIALSISYIPNVARTVRSSVLAVKEFEHVQSARAVGAKDYYILLRYIFPLCISPLIVRLTLVMGLTILSESTLTFLGVGISPSIPSWGNILSEGKLYMTTSPWVTIYPGIAIVATVLGVNLLGDGLRDLLDPRLSNS